MELKTEHIFETGELIRHSRYGTILAVKSQNVFGVETVKQNDGLQYWIRTAALSQYERIDDPIAAMTPYDGLKLAVYGLPGAGKDYVAESIGRRYNGPGKLLRIAFADSLRDMCRTMFPDMWDDSGKNRTLLQRVGTMMRQIDPLVWVRAMDRHWRIMHSSGDIHGGWFGSYSGVIVTDLRQPNEYRYLRQMGFTIVHVTAPNELRSKRLKDRDGSEFQNMAHPTESHYDKFTPDYVIVNDGRDLYEDYENILRMISE